MKRLRQLNHRCSLAVAAALTIGVGVLLVVDAPDDATGRGDPPVGDGEGSVTLTSIGNFRSPVNVAFAPGEPKNVYVVEQGGLVRVVGPLGVRQTFLDLSDQTRAFGEQGLLGLAFHPDYQANDLVYAYYTDASSGDIVISEFTAPDPADADESSRREVLSIRHRMATNHNGGQLLFGPDGYLYTATGDGGGAGDPQENAQDRRSLLGKLLRIDPVDPPGAERYSVPDGNPFVGRRGRDEIYARGLRNPFRFSFARRRILIGDVGQSRFEEVDYEKPKTLRNANFGWDRWEAYERYREGDVARTPKRRNHDKPIFAYGRSACDGGCSVIGGVVVRDPALRNLYGRYLFADAFAGRLRSFLPRLRGARDVKYLDQGPVGFPTSFASDPVTDEVYVSSIIGPVYRLEP